MIDIGAITGLAQSIGAIRKIANAMLQAHDARLLRDQATAIDQLVSEALQRVIEAQAAVLAIQQELAAALARERALEAKVTEFENWDLEKQRYELKQVSPGAFAYVVKPVMQGEEPVHWLCAGCYQRRKKTILQVTGYVGPLGNMAVWKCPVCEGVIRTVTP